MEGQLQKWGGRCPGPGGAEGVLGGPRTLLPSSDLSPALSSARPREARGQGSG